MNLNSKLFCKESIIPFTDIFIYYVRKISENIFKINYFTFYKVLLPNYR